MCAAGPVDSELTERLPPELALLALAYALSDPKEAFLQACRAGDIGLARSLAVLLGADREALDICGAFGSACGAGHLNLARWLADRFGLTAGEAYAERGSTGGPLFRACAAGRLVLAQWLVEHFGPPPSAILASMAALHCACAAGHLAVAKWIAGPGRSGLAALQGGAFAGARPDLQEAVEAVLLEMAAGGLREVCRAGHLEVAQWLVERFTLGAGGVRGEWARQEALEGACAGGHLAVLQWADRHLAGSAAIHVDSDRLHALGAGGNLDMARWLVARNAVPAGTIRAAAEKARARGDADLEGAIRRLAEPPADGTGAPGAARFAARRRV